MSRLDAAPARRPAAQADARLSRYGLELCAVREPHPRALAFHAGNPAVLGEPGDRWLCDPFFRKVCPYRCAFRVSAPTAPVNANRMSGGTLCAPDHNLIKAFSVTSRNRGPSQGRV